MTGDLGVAAVDINVAITAYVLTLAVLIPVSGWPADRFGRAARPLDRWGFALTALGVTALVIGLRPWASRSSTPPRRWSPSPSPPPC